MASSARFNFWESTAASLLATSWSTALTTGVPAACRFRPSAVTSARTALRSDGSSARFTSPSVSRRSTSWVTLDRTCKYEGAFHRASIADNRTTGRSFAQNIFVPILYRYPAFDALDDFRDFL